MNKRLRKKKHYGEFREWGRQLQINLNRNDIILDFFDDFIAYIESINCFVGGGGKGDGLDVVIELGGLSDDREGRMKSIIGWLSARPDVQSWKVGEDIDLWHS